MRWCVYLHLSAVAICAIFSLADRGLFVSHSTSQWFEDNLSALLLPALAAWIACPLTAAFISMRRVRRSQKVGYGLLAEAILSVAQMAALLPAVV